MSCTQIDNRARACDEHVVQAPIHPADTETPRSNPTAVQDSTDPTPMVNHASREQSNRILNWPVGAGLAILIVVLAAVMLHAASNVEVLP